MSSRSVGVIGAVISCFLKCDGHEVALVDARLRARRHLRNDVSDSRDALDRELHQETLVAVFDHSLDEHVEIAQRVAHSVSIPTRESLGNGAFCISSARNEQNM